MTAFTSPDSRLEYDFDPDAFLTIEIRGQWSKVDPNVFRSWSGNRCLNGQPYDGPTYLFLTNERVHGADDPAQKALRGQGGVS